ncbi:Serine/arginine-rich SC35-like splicing factor SCL30A [Abeliophyllum distichum]|uniref:Serine/arginine-rich SC35-like splicing factor SCL30A n=1 Tax=Abeliophyllum distichum TaxID=126358 RepID=A0ABD1VTZ5_9LAMI
MICIWKSVISIFIGAPTPYSLRPKCGGAFGIFSPGFCNFAKMRGRSYSPSPPRGYGRRGRSPSPRGHYGGHGRGDAPTSLLVRNLRQDCREPRGFGFVQYVDPADAVEAKYQMDGQVLQGRQLTVVFAEENRKKPTEMRFRERGGSVVLDSSKSIYPKEVMGIIKLLVEVVLMIEDGLLRVILDLLLHAMAGLDLSSRDYFSPPPKRRYSRSVSPLEKRYGRERSFSQSPLRGPSPSYNGLRSHSRTPVRERSPYGRRSLSRSPGGDHSPARGQSRRSPGRSRSPYHMDYPREPGRDGSPGH